MGKWNVICAFSGRKRQNAHNKECCCGFGLGREGGGDPGAGEAGLDMLLCSTVEKPAS